jgi:hypothetical protein
MHMLAEKIDTLQRRLRLRQRMTAVCWTAATILAAAILLGFTDYWLQYTDRGMRVLATVALAAAGGWAVYRWWYGKRNRPASALAVARRVEARYPQLRDSLASAVEFLQQSEDDPTAGSAQLRRIVIAETETSVAGLPIDDVIDERPLRRAAFWVGVALAAVAICLLLNARAVGTAVARLVAPFGNAEWPRKHYLEFRDPPTRLAVGQDFEARLFDRSGRLPGDVRVEFRVSENGRRRTFVENMTPMGEAMVARRENVRQSFSFRAEGGDDRAMRWIHVDVVEPPRAESLEVTVHPPAYTGLTAVVAEPHLDVLEGSRIEVSGAASEPLAAARIIVDGAEAIAAQIGEGTANQASGHFHIAAGKWIATKSGSYELELESLGGIRGVVASWQLRVRPDASPTIAWRRPGEDLHVLLSATVPIEFVVKDDLSIRSVAVIYERAGRGGTENEIDQKAIGAKRGTLELYRGPEQAAASTDEMRVVEGQWSLAPLKLKPGDGLTLRGVATDYRPGEGQTSAPRRIAVVTIEELDARLVEQQTEIVRQLEKALSAERATREEVRRVAIGQADGGQLSPGDHNSLATAEVNQRRVRWMLSDPDEGLPAMVDALLAELTMNGVASPDIERAMRGLRATLNELASGPLDTAERELTAARKLSDAVSQQADDALEAKELPSPSFDLPLEQHAGRAPSGELGRSLSTVGAAQEEVIAVVERLTAELSDAADFERFIRQLSELRADQINHERATRAEMGPGKLPLEPDELTRDQRANLNKAAAGQETMARRYEKVSAGLRKLADELDLKDAAASNTLKDAVALGDRLSIAANMQDATSNLSENRIGRALELEQQIASDLESVLNVLRKRAPQREDRLNELKRAEEELNKLREQLATLRNELTQAEAQGNPPAERARLGQRQDELRRAAEELARQIERAQAAGAARSTQQAADQLETRPPGAIQNAAPPRPGRPEQVQDAERKLEDAARELAEERAKAELDMALEFINRFRAELEQMIQRQRAVISDTAEIDAARQAAGSLSASDAGRLEQLAAEERALAELADQHRAVLSSLAAVRISLQESQRRLAAAGELLAARQSGAIAQQAEEHALARLVAMMEAFAQTAAEAQRPPGAGNPGGGGNQGGGPQRRPAFELLEVKMLRMLQVELNQRTEAYQVRLAGAEGPPNEAQRAELAREAQELAAEQRRLAELVQEMLSRNNRQQQDEER